MFTTIWTMLAGVLAGLSVTQAINLSFAALCVGAAFGASPRQVMWVSALLYLALVCA